MLPPPERRSTEAPTIDNLGSNSFLEWLDTMALLRSLNPINPYQILRKYMQELD
jgi:hypothetical protein